MEQQNVERRLAAILVGDVAGYSRLMGSDEEGTLAQLKAHQSALVDPKIRECHGKIIKTTGDGMLVTFPSAVEAVRCAVEVQRGMAERNADLPPEERIEFRLGINVGDVIHDNKDIFGEGVNIAARLETLAEPGGICVSQAVRDPVRHNRGFTFEDMGEQTLKNISAPIHAYRVRLENVEPTAHATSVTWLRHRRKIVVFGLASGFAVATIVVGVWQSRPPRVPSQAASAQPSAPLPLPDKPSIAVLPFTNIGGDAKQERLTDGITEDVITDLSHYHGLFVIARNSVMTYKGKTVNVQQVGRELGVRYVLEGSIQTSGDHIRVTAQLIDAKTGGHVWSDRYDRSLDDIFEVQSEVTQKIAATLGGVTGTLAAADASSIRRKPPASLQAYDYYVLGQEHHYRTTKEDFVKAEELLTKAIGLDPQFARAYFALGHLYNTEAYWGWGNEEPTALFEKAKVALLKAIALDPSDAIAHAVLGEVYLSMSDYDHGFAELEQAFALNPNDPTCCSTTAWGSPASGRRKRG